jgi:hypothetical protein
MLRIVGSGDGYDPAVGDLARYFVGSIGGIVIVVGLVGILRILLGRSSPRPAVAALETVAWFVVVIACGGLLVLVASRM